MEAKSRRVYHSLVIEVPANATRKQLEKLEEATRKINGAVAIMLHKETGMSLIVDHPF